MNRLILDHLRRNAWMLAFGAVLELIAGWLGAAGGSDAFALHLQVGFLMGPFLLFLDLQRGLARNLSVLPLCARQIGRAWWLATVAIPAAGCSAVLFSGAGLASLIHPGYEPAWDRLALSSLCLFLWTGTAFPLVTNLFVGMSTHRWRSRLRTLSGALWGLLLGAGFLLFQDLDREPLRLAGFFVVCLPATLAGWLRSGRIFEDGPSFCPAAHHLERDPAPGPLPSHRPGGHGGLPMLIGHAFLRTFSIGFAVIVLQPLIPLLQGRLETWPRALGASSGVGFFPFWLIVFFAFSPLLLQWRLMRSLPLSAGRLAAGLLLAALLPVAVLGVLHAGFLGLAVGNTAAQDIATYYLLALATGAFSLLPIAWLGAGALSYLLLVGLTIFAQFTPLYLDDSLGPGPALGLTGLVTAVAVTLAFLLTRHALTHTTRAYRMQPNSFTHGCAPGR